MSAIGFERPGRGTNGRWVAEQFIGRRVRWGDIEHCGTITGVITGNGGYVRYVIEWDEGTPEWWSTEIAPSSNFLLV